MINLRIKNINHLHKSLEYSILLFISCFAFGRSFKEVATAIMFVTLVLLKINGIKVFPAHRLSKVILIYGTVLFFSMLLSSDPVRSFEVLGDTVKAFIVVFAVAAYVKSDKEIKKILYAFLFVGLFQGIDGIYQYVFGIDFVWGTKLVDMHGRVTGSMRYWHVGNLMAFILPMIFILIEISKRNWEKIVLILMIFLPIATMILSKTRSSWVSFASSFIIMFVFSKKKLLYVPLCIIPIVFIAFAPPDLVNRFNDLVKMEDSGRLGIWAVSIEMFKDSPAIGHGIGTFKEVYTDYKKELPQYDSPHRTPHAHNIYIHALAELGIVGFSALMFLLYSLLTSIVSTIKKSRGDPVLYSFSVAVLGSMTVYIVEGFLTHGLFRMWLMQMFAIIVGLALSVSAMSVERTNEKPN